jgi:hypothetical protein
MSYVGERVAVVCGMTALNMSYMGERVAVVCGMTA